MQKESRFHRCLTAALIVFTILCVDSAAAQRPVNTGNDRLGDIIMRLERIEAKLIDPGPTTSATFCISQGRALELGVDWAAELKVEIEGGLGWAEVGDLKLVGAPSFPFLLAPAIPVPVPTDAAIGLAGGIGRGLEICVDLPVTLSPEDQALLDELATDINAKTGDGVGQKGKFQRRTRRILNYTALRVPGRQRSFSLNQNGPTALEAQENGETEFDRADAAVDEVLDNGLGAVTEGLAVFQEANIKELLETVGIPANVKNFMRNPDQIFDGLPSVRSGVDHLTCDTLGVTLQMQGRIPALDDLCVQLNSLPKFKTVKDAFETIDQMSDEIVDAIAEVLNPVLSSSSSGGGETAAQTKSRFCASAIGQRRAFNRYCGRT